MTDAYVAPYLVDGDPVSGELVHEFLDAVETAEAPSRISRVSTRSTLDMNLTLSDQVIPGVTINFSVTGKNAFAMFFGVIGCNSGAGGAATQLLGTLYLSGSALDSLILKDYTTADRSTGMQTWGMLLTPGYYTAQLKARKDINVGTITTMTGSCTLTALLVDLP